MAHPLYPVARRMVGRHVHAHHTNGRVYPGILQNVTQNGIYLLPMNYASYAKTDTNDLTTLEAITDTPDTTQVYAPAGYFAFGALTGLTLGALAARRPYYGGYGGYGGGYGGYGGYGGGFMW